MPDELPNPFGCFEEAELRRIRIDSIVDSHSMTIFAEAVSILFVTRSMNSAQVAFPVVGSTMIRLTIASVRIVSRPVSFAANKGSGTRLRLGAAYLQEITGRSGHLASTVALKAC